MKFLPILILLSFFSASAIKAQVDGFDRLPKPDPLEGDTLVVGYDYIIIDGDTIRIFDLPQVSIFPNRVFTSRGDRRRYERLVLNVLRVYPFAKLAGQKFIEYQKVVESMPSKRERRRAMKEAEDKLREQFEDDIKRLTFNQGVILIKLIDRETRHTSYGVLREFRGFFPAMFWQGLGRIFGFNLRTKYDPEGEDALIEEIVQQIELGYLPLP